MWAEYLTSDQQPDLVHIQGFSTTLRLRAAPRRAPIVLGAGTGGYGHLKYYHGWDDPRLKRARRIKRCYLAAVGAHDSSLRPERAAHIVTWSSFSRQMHLDEGRVRPDQISILHPGLPQPPVAAARASRGGSPVTFIFVGREFERKNGYLVLDAFRSVHAGHPHTRLLLVSAPQDGRVITEAGVAHRLFAPRAELLSTLYPQADVLLLPSKAEGYGLAIVEAMSFGLPAIAVDAWAMPEIVEHGVNGFLIRPNSLDDLIAAMSRLAGQPELLPALRQASLSIFRSRFSIEAHNLQLARVYADALKAR
jgi:glycosyltransferase involved in cell wall biosynthesis